jgi:hypothetical protein
MKFDGGPAFPIGPGVNGMTLRDYIAVRAMQTIISPNFDFKTVALMAYQLADAMLEERKKDDTYIQGKKLPDEFKLSVRFDPFEDTDEPR